MEKKFSLKDFLFNEQKIQQLVKQIQRVYPAFDSEKFVQQTVTKFPELELKERITWISQQLKQFLPEDYRKATEILLKSLPPPNDNTKTDNDFGDFVYASYAEFVAKNGCTKEYLDFSLNALKEITMRFSVEDAIRYFINTFPKETLTELKKWSMDSHYHVRRAASEGTRPKLPWSQKIGIPVEASLPILDNLFLDKTRFVTRSVANHINDISKINPDLALQTLDRWQKSQKQTPEEMEYIIKHALRTLVKVGYKDAVEFLNFSSDPQVTITNFMIKQNPVTIGSAVEFFFNIKAKKDERLFIDYVLYFQNKSGVLTNKKVFKLTQCSVKKGQTIVIQKRHKLRRDMTTRILYPGEHAIEIQINGRKMAKKEFYLST